MLTDDQWSVLEPLFQKERTGAGRPQIHSDREVLKWRPLGLAYRRGMGGLTGQVSIFRNLLSEIQQMGKRWKASKNSGVSGPAS